MDFKNKYIKYKKKYLKIGIKWEVSIYDLDKYTRFSN